MRGIRPQTLVRRVLPACVSLIVAGASLRIFMELITVPAPIGLFFLVFGIAAGLAGFGFLVGRPGMVTLVGLAFGAICAAALTM